tara:strand:- start:4 stop:216 length:213 start_codon:yes stop_codon:yes gene_type:complete
MHGNPITNRDAGVKHDVRMQYTPGAKSALFPDIDTWAYVSSGTNTNPVFNDRKRPNPDILIKAHVNTDDR